MSLTPHDIARMLDHSTLQPFLTEDDIPVSYTHLTLPTN